MVSPEVEGAGFRLPEYMSERRADSDGERAVLAFGRPNIIGTVQCRSAGRVPDMSRIRRLSAHLRRSSATTRSTLLQSIAISPRTTTSAVPCCGCPRVDRLTREFLPDRRGQSAIGQLRRLGDVRATSVLHLSADLHREFRQVSKVPTRTCELSNDRHERRPSLGG